MSSAEAELVAITEGAKEAVGVVALEHIWGMFRTCQEPPAILVNIFPFALYSNFARTVCRPLV